MKSSSVALVCMTLFVQVFCVDNNNAEYSIASRSLLDKGKKKALAALGALTIAIDTELTKALAVLNDAYDTLNTTVEEYQGKTNYIIDIAMKPLNKKMKGYMEKVTTLGLNVSHCEQHVDDFTNLPKTILGRMISCPISKLDRAKNYVDDTLKQIQVLERNAAAFGVKIEECDGTIRQRTKCLAALVSQITVMSVEAPVKIVWNVGNVALLINGLTPSLKACFAISAGSVTAEGLAILGKFLYCVGLPKD